MRNYIIRRLLYSLVILFLVSILIFVMVRLLPGDPIEAAAMQNSDLADKSIIADLREHFGLNRPVHIQYLIWLRDFFRGEWGKSLGSGELVMDMFLKRLPVTIELFLGAMFWSFIIGFPVGIISALKRNSALDASLTTSAIIGVSIPAFWEGIVFIYIFAVILRILPPSGYVPFWENPWENIRSVIMPTFIMGTQTAGLLARYVRSSLLEVLGQDFIRTARAKGLRERAVIAGHAFKPAMIPVTTVIGLSWSYLVAGSFIVEFMFAIPGLGRMGVEAVFARDFPVLQAVLIIVALNVLLVNLAVDLIYGYLDPRVRLQK
ncbi:MAG: ABC transporter permease [Deltaproteobacteria bacterium]|nr:ABC transporter permease [Deltaproteobacteria bacterium]